jgi:Amt family ammonium transporter
MQQHTPIDMMWVMVAAILVVMMQAGFACVESGLVRAKNSINVAFKNLIDFCIACVLYAVIGFAFMFGASAGGWIGVEHELIWTRSDPWFHVFFFFQVAFCGTATTIVSGAVAERMRFSAYCLTAAFVSAVIYPVAGHWAWGGALDGTPTGVLATHGFIDFAGSTVVHSVGGWVSLACLLVLGPRLGRFDAAGIRIEGYSLPMATLGAFTLWVGWFGFNGGSTLAWTDQVPIIVVNTAIAGAAGGIGAMAISWLQQGRPIVDSTINGVLAGLVAITAGCHLLSVPMSIVDGFIGGIVSVLCVSLLERLKIDDAVGAVPVHLAAGIWGTLAVALLAPDGSWGAGVTRSAQLFAQIQGILLIGAYAFFGSLVFFKLVDHFMKLRVSPEEERVGLNVAEHGASSALLDLLVQMDRQAREGDFSRHVEVEPETEAASIATFYNSVLERVNLESGRSKMALKTVAQLANYDTLTGLANRRLYFEALSRAIRTARLRVDHAAVMYIDLDNFKRINDTHGHKTGDRFLQTAAQRIQAAVRTTDLVARLGGDEFCIVLESLSDPEVAGSIAQKILDSFAVPFSVAENQFWISGSIGIAIIGPQDQLTANELTQNADQAMYTAKLSGKNRYRFFDQNMEGFAPDV